MTCCGVIFVLVLSAKQVKTEEQIAAEQAWYGSEKVWLVHKDGFSLGKSKPLGLVTFMLVNFSFIHSF